jgi:activating signal cointegrator 1
VKALTMTQPWATLVAIGANVIETRDWPTKHRGPFAIHAAKGFPPDARALCRTRPFRDALAAGGYESSDALPLGAVVALVRDPRALAAWGAPAARGGFRRLLRRALRLRAG